MNRFYIMICFIMLAGIATSQQFDSLSDIVTFMSTFQGVKCMEADTNVWNVLFRAGGLNIMSPVDFIRANAAAAQFRIDSSLDLSEYTNGLPQEIVREIRRE